MKKSTIFSALLFLTFISNAWSQVPENSELYQQMMKMDSLLFEEGFNNCNYAALEKITADDLEFYHDQGGITFGKEDFVESIRKNICSINYKPFRKLVEGSLKIFPLKSNGDLYGVIQSGDHDFYAKEEGRKAYLTSTAKFTNLWLKKDGRWLLKGVLSYDHQTPEEVVPLKKELFEDPEKIEAWLKDNKVPALGIALLKDNRLVQVKTYGDLYDEVPAPVNTLFNVASLTKPIVSMLTLKLVENGDWKLDKPLYHYWTDPDVKDDPNSRLLTSRHILSHQTGFKNWRWQNESGKLEFDFKPGTAYNYSGEGFEYLQKALESKFKMPLEKLADSLLFQPLKMKDTRFVWDNNVEEERFARWHDSEGNNTYETDRNTTASAADNLLTTVENYGRFAEYVLNGAGLSEDLYREMLTNQVPEGSKIKMGLGWEMLPKLKGNEYAILHTGGDKGVFTLIMMLPKTGEGVVIFTNGDNGNKLTFKIIEENLSLGRQITAQAK
jgi:CubicO group peptidase (beta-lactamase class C family)